MDDPIEFDSNIVERAIWPQTITHSRALLVGRSFCKAKLLEVELRMRRILRGYRLSAPGVGALVTRTYRSAVDDPTRFGNPIL